MEGKIYGLLIVWLLVANGVLSQTLHFEFSSGDNLFIGGVADYGLLQSDQHQFEFDNLELPAPFPPMQFAQFMKGTNPSDDLFMYMKRKITGLQSNTTYLATFIVEFASIYPTNAFGVGGPPGEGVTMKAGVTLIEPDTFVMGGIFPQVVMNIDKGNQSQPGADMDTIGHVGVTDTTTVYTLKVNDNVEKPFQFTTDGTGEGWFIVGTDSGFEATTAIYFTEISVDLEMVSADESPTPDQSVIIKPNPSFGNILVQSMGEAIRAVRIFDMQGRMILARDCLQHEEVVHLPEGTYVVRVEFGDRVEVRQVVVM